MGANEIRGRVWGAANGGLSCRPSSILRICIEDQGAGSAHRVPNRRVYRCSLNVPGWGGRYRRIFAGVALRRWRDAACARHPTLPAPTIGVLADDHVREDGRSRPPIEAPCLKPWSCLDPPAFSVWSSPDGAVRAAIGSVDEVTPWADDHAVLAGDAFTDESGLEILQKNRPATLGVLLDLDETRRSSFFVRRFHTTRTVDERSERDVPRPSLRSSATDCCFVATIITRPSRDDRAGFCT